MSGLYKSVVAGAMALGLLACHNDDPTAPVALSGLVPNDAVQAAIQQEAPAADGSITFVVRVVTKGVGVSAYQGAVTFIPGAFELVEAKVPTGGQDEAYVLNPTDFAAGRIRFAAFTPKTFAGTDVGDGVEAFRFTVKPLRPVAEANLAATLDVVGKETGIAVSTDRLLAASGVRDAAGHVINK